MDTLVLSGAILGGNVTEARVPKLLSMTVPPVVPTAPSVFSDGLVTTTVSGNPIASRHRGSIRDVVPRKISKGDERYLSRCLLH